MVKGTLKVAVTGAAGQIGYSIVYMIANGDAFGKEYSVHLVLIDLPVCKKVLEGIKMELEDCSFPLLKQIDCYVEQTVAFKDVDVAILLAGAVPLKAGMQRSELLQENKKIYVEQAKLLDQNAKPTCKVIVVANPANTNCLILAEYAKNIPKENFTALTRLDHNRARTMIAKKVGCDVDCIKKVIVWGNHSSTMVPDYHLSEYCSKPVAGIINDEDWVKNFFVPSVKERAQAIIASRGRSSCLSAAKATCDHLNSWFNGTGDGDYVSMGVLSDGSYGVPAGIVFGFPCVCVGGKYTIVKDLPLTSEIQEAIKLSADDLLEEKRMAFD